MAEALFLRCRFGVNAMTRNPPKQRQVPGIGQKKSQGTMLLKILLYRRCIYLGSYVQSFEAYVDMFKNTEAPRREGRFLMEMSVNETSDEAESYLRSLYVAYCDGTTW